MKETSKTKDNYQKHLESKAKQIWTENNLEDYLIPVYTDPYDPWGYNIGGVLAKETVDYGGFEFTKKGNKVSFVDPNGETGEFMTD